MSEERLEMSTRRANEEGSIGIGAMIVFIALILVAAVASTIIIKTAEELQQNAEQTSADTRQQISGKVALVDVIVRSTGDELGTGATHVASMDVVWRVSSGSTGMYPADVTYYMTCQVSNAVGAFYDQGPLAANLISTGAAVAASTELDAGNTYFTTITLGNADSDGGNTLTTADDGNGCDALFVQGAEIDMRISVDGGGDTATELKVNSITAGSSIM